MNFDGTTDYAIGKLVPFQLRALRVPRGNPIPQMTAEHQNEQSSILECISFQCGVPRASNDNVKPMFRRDTH